MNEPLVLEEWSGNGDWAVLRPNPKGKFFIGYFFSTTLPHRLGDLIALCPTREAAVAALRLLS